MTYLKITLLVFLMGTQHLAYANTNEEKFRTMATEAQAAVKSATLDIKAIIRILDQYFNMNVISTKVALTHIQKETKGMDADAKKKWLSAFLVSFKPIYTSYLARVWTSENNVKTLKEYELENCTFKNKRGELTFKKASGEKSYIVLDLDANDLVISLKFGARNNLIDPISADQGSCKSGVNKGQKPEDIFAAQSKLK